MEVLLENEGGIQVVGIKGRLDTSNYLQLEGKLLDLISKDSAMLIDCVQLDYISSSGLRVLLQALKKAQQQNCRLALCSLQSTIMEIFKVSAFDTIFSIYPDRAAALAGLHG